MKASFHFESSLAVINPVRNREHTTQVRCQDAYEEGLLLLRAMEYARASVDMLKFRKNLNGMILPLSKGLE